MSLSFISLNFENNGSFISHTFFVCQNCLTKFANFDNLNIMETI